MTPTPPASSSPPSLLHVLYLLLFLSLLLVLLFFTSCIFFSSSSQLVFTAWVFFSSSSSSQLVLWVNSKTLRIAQIALLSSPRSTAEIHHWNCVFFFLWLICSLLLLFTLSSCTNLVTIIWHRTNHYREEKEERSKSPSSDKLEKCFYCREGLGYLRNTLQPCSVITWSSQEKICIILQKKWFNIDTFAKRNWSLVDRRDVRENSEMQNSSTQLLMTVKKQKALMSQKMSR